MAKIITWKQKQNYCLKGNQQRWLERRSLILYTHSLKTTKISITKNTFVFFKLRGISKRMYHRLHRMSYAKQPFIYWKNYTTNPFHSNQEILYTVKGQDLSFEFCFIVREKYYMTVTERKEDCGCCWQQNLGFQEVRRSEMVRFGHCSQNIKISWANLSQFFFSYEKGLKTGQRNVPFKGNYLDYLASNELCN